MSADVEDARASDMTLAFDLPAFRAFLQPRSVFHDAKQWSRYVGVVGDDPRAVEAAVAGRGIYQDFELGEYDKQSVLSRLKWEADTERYVIIGTDEETRELAEYVGWEYLSVEKAAEKAGWKLAYDAGFGDRLRASLSRASWWVRTLAVRRR